MRNRTRIARARRLITITRLMAPAFVRIERGLLASTITGYRMAWRGPLTCRQREAHALEVVFQAARAVTEHLESYGNNDWGLKRPSGGIVPLAPEHAGLLLSLHDYTNDVLRERA
jgi:hypothetical protein